MPAVISVGVLKRAASRAVSIDPTTKPSASATVGSPAISGE